jgi:branched-chain amino acid transport system substrate-binding protein
MIARVVARAGRGVFLAAAAVLATCDLGVAAPAAGDYGIGFITETTGPLAAAGVSYYRGAQLAIGEINESGYVGPGVTLKLSSKESGSDAARAVQALSQFAADRNVIAATCCILSPVAAALKPVTLSAKLPLVIYGATLPGLPNPPYVTSIVGLPGPQEVKMSHALADALKPKSIVYFVNADNEGFQNRYKAARKVMEGAGAKTADVISILSSDTDFTAGATQAIADNPDLIMVWTTQTPAAGIIAALRARDYKGHISASDVISPAPMFKKIGPALADVPFPVLFSPEISKTPEAKAFVEGYAKKFGAAPDTYSAQGYTAIYFIAQALKSLDGKPTREALADAIGKIQSIGHNVYGGVPMRNGQADVENSLIAEWTKDGKVVRWESK